MTAQLNPTYTQVKNSFESLRELALKIAHDDLRPVISNKRQQAVLKNEIQLDTFTFNTQRELRKWKKTGLRGVAWDWDAVQKKYKSHLKRFELSIWYRGRTLCAASIGRPTWGGGKLRLDYIESAPMGTVLDGLATDITIAAGAAYARAIGATQLRIMNPVNDTVKNQYLSKQDFLFNEKGNFCFMDL